MARPQSEGLDYFPLDVDMDSDEKIEYIEAKYGLVAFGIIVKLMMAIYRQGYYIMWTERQQYVFSKRVNVDINTLSTVVIACINEGLFDKHLFEKYGVLTSHGVQVRYLRAVERRRGIRMIREFCLLTEKDDIKEGRIAYENIAKTVIVDNNPRSSDVIVDNMSAITTQSKVKESKVNIYAAAANAREDSQDEKELGEVIKAFCDNLQPFAGNMVLEQLGDAFDTYGKTWCMEAIREAAANGGRSIQYVNRILERWARDGFKAKRKGNEKHGGIDRSRGHSDNAGAEKSVYAEYLDSCADASAEDADRGTGERDEDIAVFREERGEAAHRRRSPDSIERVS